jgi:hypothetical protein
MVRFEVAASCVKSLLCFDTDKGDLNIQPLLPGLFYIKILWLQSSALLLHCTFPVVHDQVDVHEILNAILKVKFQQAFCIARPLCLVHQSLLFLPGEFLHRSADVQIIKITCTCSHCCLFILFKIVLINPNICFYP